MLTCVIEDIIDMDQQRGGASKRELNSLGKDGGDEMPAPMPRWPQFKQVLRREEVMDCMMQARGADVLTAVRANSGQAYLEARAMCRRCVHESECREWLASAPQTQRPPDFCPNFEFFSRCRATDSEPAPAPSRDAK